MTSPSRRARRAERAGRTPYAARGVAQLRVSAHPSATRLPRCALTSGTSPARAAPAPLGKRAGSTCDSSRVMGANVHEPDIRAADVAAALWFESAWDPRAAAAPGYTSWKPEYIYKIETPAECSISSFAYASANLSCSLSSDGRVPRCRCALGAACPPRACEALRQP